jgi:hypothetical protein
MSHGVHSAMQFAACTLSHGLHIRHSTARCNTVQICWSAYVRFRNTRSVRCYDLGQAECGCSATSAPSGCIHIAVCSLCVALKKTGQSPETSETQNDRQVSAAHAQCHWLLSTAASHVGSARALQSSAQLCMQDGDQSLRFRHRTPPSHFYLASSHIAHCRSLRGRN